MLDRNIVLNEKASSIWIMFRRENIQILIYLKMNTVMNKNKGSSK